MDPAYKSEVDYAAGAFLAWSMATFYAVLGLPWGTYALMAAFSILFGAWRVRRISRRLA